ncbi:uncharacterized protein PHALS_13087 [Plasmopara halstedii]|uniref:Transmembrane protein n=1 Tax=Plasmopara halstedii TaxID=4781 RepID=A0A0P1AN13_PLAHL|nr:uncharacterized protein PHALS_13087 [Plasmopara halstedii]CEG42847.1 hypothetical protein PHALS_13087 [Plasmopara halstedii]|eukprot:XP_024579216.1 hypothetical protein PHALS_13087 [Plasmopara halstedii]
MLNKKGLPQAARVLIFLVLNNLLASAGFIVLLFSVAFSLGSLTLCCLGVVGFQGLLYMAPLLAQLDIKLHNFVEPVEYRLCGSIPHYGEGGSYLARPSLAVLLYFSTAKVGVGVLSAMVVIFPFSMPIHALLSPTFRAQYLGGSWFNVWTFMVVATAMIVVGVIAMPSVARLSCVTTRLLCREVFPSIRLGDHALSSSKKPLCSKMTSYGTKQSILTANEVV